MAINLVDTIQKNLGLPELQKIDPNTQEVKKPASITEGDYIGQAAIPTVLLGLYKYSRTKEGNVEILKGELSGNLLSSIFGDLRDTVIDKVAHYTNNSVDFTSMQMEKIAREAVHLVRENLKGNTTDNAVTLFLTDQRHHILTCLPAELQIGEVLHDNTVDDRIHKMEGPISGAVHWAEKLFSISDRKKEENF
jgi:hypothetical protein